MRYGGSRLACASVRQLQCGSQGVIVTTAPSHLLQGESGSLRLITREDGEPLDTWTFVPEELDDDRRYTTWISAEPSTFADLEEWR